MQRRYGVSEMKKTLTLQMMATGEKEIANGYDPNITPETNDSIFCTQTP